MKIITLSRGQEVKVDDSDFDELSKWEWHAGGRGPNVHASRWMLDENGKRINVFMARILTGVTKGSFVEHKDGDNLNNQRDNLKICSRFEWRNNEYKRHGKVSPYRGVVWSKTNSCWLARTTVELGSFNTEKEAALAYDAFDKKYRGYFARPNFPEVKEVLSCEST